MARALKKKADLDDFQMLRDRVDALKERVKLSGVAGGVGGGGADALCGEGRYGHARLNGGNGEALKASSNGEVGAALELRVTAVVQISVSAVHRRTAQRVQLQRRAFVQGWLC